MALLEAVFHWIQASDFKLNQDVSSHILVQCHICLLAAIFLATKIIELASETVRPQMNSFLFKFPGLCCLSTEIQK